MHCKPISLKLERRICSLTDLLEAAGRLPTYYICPGPSKPGGQCIKPVECGFKIFLVTSSVNRSAAIILVKVLKAWMGRWAFSAK